MTYSHHVFISYRRNKQWSGLVKLLHDHLETHLTSGIDPSIGPVSIYRDTTDPAYGAQWPSTLAKALSGSRVLVPILWSEYFFGDSVWCREELSAMLARRDRIFASTGVTPRCVFPIIIYPHPLPPELEDTQYIDISAVAHPFVKPNTRTALRMWELLQPFAKQIADALLEAPPLDPEWEGIDARAFWHLFTQVQREQRSRPSHGDAPLEQRDDGDAVA